MRPPWFFQPFSTGTEGLDMILSLASVTTSMWARATSIPDNSSSALASLFPWSSSSSATSPSGEQPSNLHPFSNLIRSFRTQELIKNFYVFCVQNSRNKKKDCKQRNEDDLDLVWNEFLLFCVCWSNILLCYFGDQGDSQPGLLHSLLVPGRQIK